jgi:Na+/melibiose symporter-like transporter
MDDLTAYAGLAGVPLIAGLIQVAKPWVGDKRLWPVIALVLGIALNVIIALARQGNVTVGVVLGIIVGLAASGLWSGPKAVSGR